MTENRTQTIRTEFSLGQWHKVFVEQVDQFSFTLGQIRSTALAEIDERFLSFRARLAEHRRAFT